MKLFLLAIILAVGMQAALAQSAPPIVLTGGHLVDVVRGEIYEDITIVCEGDNITGLFFDFAYNDHRIPPGAVRVDVSGKYLVPGLIDLHVHANTRLRNIEVNMEHFFRLFLKGGVTTIRAMSDDMAALIRHKTVVDSGRMDGPNIVIGAPVFEQAPGFPKHQRTDIVNNPIEARQLVSDYAYQGADWIKFYNYGDADVVKRSWMKRTSTAKRFSAILQCWAPSRHRGSASTASNTTSHCCRRHWITTTAFQ